MLTCAEETFPTAMQNSAINAIFRAKNFFDVAKCDI
jgi:hypothetical protein